MTGTTSASTPSSISASPHTPSKSSPESSGGRSIGTEACIFCEIVSGEAEAHSVYEGEDGVAFLDRRPLFPGHVLVVPRHHRETVEDLDPAEVGPLFGLVRRIARSVRVAMAAEGTFVAANNRVSQSVPHLHVHIVPRTKGDGLRGFFWPRNPYENERAMEAAAAIRAELDRGGRDPGGEAASTG
ncbi:MAG: HIT family protein [Solirubrobacterales bacterium]